MTKFKLSFYFIFLLCSCIHTYSIASVENKFRGISIHDSEFYGSGDNNSAYVIKADESNQIDSEQHLLKKITGTYSASNKKDGFNLIADQGIYNSAKQTLELFYDIVLNFDLGYKLTTKKLSVDFHKTLVYSEDPTEIKGINEKIISKTGFVNNMKEKTVYFSGPVTTTFIRR